MMDEINVIIVQTDNITTAGVPNILKYSHSRL